MSAQHFKQVVIIFIITVFAGYQISVGQIFGSNHELKRNESFSEQVNNAEILHFLLQKDIRGGHITILPSQENKITVDVEYIVVSTDKAKGQKHLDDIKTSVNREKDTLIFSSTAPRNNSLFFNTGGFPSHIKKEQVNYTVKMPPVSTIQTLKTVTDNGNIKINEMQINHYELHNDDGNVTVTSCSGNFIKINTDNGTISTDQCDIKSINANADDGNMFISGISEKIELNVDNGTINLKDCQGQIRLNADDGNINLNEVNGSLHVSIDNGKVESKNSTFNDVSVTTDDGRIHLGNANGSIHLNTDNGNIFLSESKGEITFSTDDGSVMLENCSGVVRGNTDNGSFEIQNGAWEEITVQVDDGNIRINSKESAETEISIHADNTNVDVNLPTAKELQIETQDGNIKVNTPEILEEANVKTRNGQIHLSLDPSQPYAIHAKTRNGKINNNLPFEAVDDQKKNEFKGKIGKGSIPLTVETDNGSIHLNR